MCDDLPSPAVSVVPGPSTVVCCFSFPVPSRLHEGIAFSQYGKFDHHFLASNQTNFILVYSALRLAFCVIEATEFVTMPAVRSTTLRARNPVRVGIDTESLAVYLLNGISLSTVKCR